MRYEIIKCVQMKFENRIYMRCWIMFKTINNQNLKHWKKHKANKIDIKQFIAYQFQFYARQNYQTWEKIKKLVMKNLKLRINKQEKLENETNLFCEKENKTNITKLEKHKQLRFYFKYIVFKQLQTNEQIKFFKKNTRQNSFWVSWNECFSNLF